MEREINEILSRVRGLEDKLKRAVSDLEREIKKLDNRVDSVHRDVKSIKGR